jgi:hypothetical protein
VTVELLSALLKPPPFMKLGVRIASLLPFVSFWRVWVVEEERCEQVWKDPFAVWRAFRRVDSW